MSFLARSVQNLAWRGYMNTAARLHELRSISWEATRRCNLACRHCANESSPRADAGAELTAGQVLDCFQTVREDFDITRLAVSIGGGEPLMRRDLFKVTEGLNGMGFNWGLVTNGMLLNRHKLRQCLDTGMASVSISLDGLKEHHEELRGKGSFRPALNSIQLVLGSGMAGQVEVTTVLTGPVARRITEVHGFMESLGVPNWRILPMALVGRARDNAELKASAEETVRVLDWLVEQRTGGGSMEISLDESGFLGEKYERHVRPAPFMCSAGINSAQICYDGEVTGCPFISRSFSQGNVTNRRFSEIWEQGFKALRDRRWTKCGMCATCRSHADCRGGCMVNWDSPDAQGPRSCFKEFIEGGRK